MYFFLSLLFFLWEDMEEQAQTWPAGPQPINTPLTSPPVETWLKGEPETVRAELQSSMCFIIWILLSGCKLKGDETLMIPVGKIHQNNDLYSNTNSNLQHPAWQAEILTTIKWSNAPQCWQTANVCQEPERLVRLLWLQWEERTTEKSFWNMANLNNRT